jgi:16S rRNA (guanine527-N7)-methyltransferase
MGLLASTRWTSSAALAICRGVSRGTIASVSKPDERALVLRRARELALALDEPRVEAILTYTALLTERAATLGLVSRADSGRLLERHVLDSLRAGPVIQDLGASRVLDLGSGAGLPGLVLAIALPQIEFVLAESRSRRAAFLELAVERLELVNARVHPGPAETLHLHFTACTARAFAPLEEAWSAARERLEPGGSLVFFAGAAERLPDSLPGARSIEAVHRPAVAGKSTRAIDHAPGRPVSASTRSRGTPSPERESSPGRFLASGGDLVIITAK